MAAGDADYTSVNALLMGDDGGTERRAGVTAGGALEVFAHHAITHQREALLNDSDKTFTVPANRIWHLHSVLVDYTATATAGTRLIVIHCRDANDDHVLTVRGHSDPIASEQHIINFAAGYSNEENTTDLAVAAFFPMDVILPPGFDVRVFDGAAIDATADDMTVQLAYDEYTV